MFIPRFAVAIISAGILVLGAGVVAGQDYPNKPIRIVTSAAGGGSDFTTRQIAQGITGPLEQPVIVENRAAPVIATETVAKAPPDGYTLLVGGGTLWLMPLMQKVNYDPVRDFSPISLVERSPNVLVVHPSLPVKSVKELISLAKARPGELTYSSSGLGGTTWLSGELLKSMAGVNIVSIPYKTGTQANTAVLNGEVQLAFPTAGVVAPFVKSGRLKALAITSAEPSALVPGLPTIAASGLPGYELVGVSGIWAPAKTPGAIINRLNREIVRALNLPDVKERFLNGGSEAVGTSPEQFAAYIKSSTATVDKLVKDAGINVK